MRKLIISFIDTETAGLPKDMKAPYSDTDNWPYILSFARFTVKVDIDIDGMIKEHEVVGAGEYIVFRPNVVNPPESMAVNGITPQLQAKHGVDISHVLYRAKWTLKKSDLIVCHNVEFDKGVIGAEFHRANMEYPTSKWFCTKEDIGDITGLPATEKQRAYRPNINYKLLRLDELYQHLFEKPIENRETHGALKDAKACAECFFRLNKQGRIIL